MSSNSLPPKMEQQCINILKHSLKCFETKNPDKECEKSYYYAISCINNKLNNKFNENPLMWLPN